MVQYIDKDALVAEIDKRLHQLTDAAFDSMIGRNLTEIKDFLDTLEVKEVDLEKEYKDFIKCDNGRSMFETAKHFFELGMSVSNKAQKGE